MGRKKQTFGKTNRSRRLVGKNGQYNAQNKKNHDALVREIESRDDLTLKQKQDLIKDLDVYIDVHRKNGKTGSVNGFWSKELKITKEDRALMSEEELKEARAMLKMEKAFSNMGLDVDELAGELKTTRKDLLDKNNWSGNILTIDGKNYYFRFTYSGKTLIEQSLVETKQIYDPDFTWE